MSPTGSYTKDEPEILKFSGTALILLAVFFPLLQAEIYLYQANWKESLIHYSFLQVKGINIYTEKNSVGGEGSIQKDTRHHMWDMLTLS